MTALEQSIIDLCKQHSLTCITFTVYPSHKGAEFTCYTHRSAGMCGSASRGSFEEAVKVSLADLIVTEGVEIADEAIVA